MLVQPSHDVCSEAFRLFAMHYAELSPFLISLSNSFCRLKYRSDSVQVCLRVVELLRSSSRAGTGLLTGRGDGPVGTANGSCPHGAELKQEVRDHRSETRESRALGYWGDSDLSRGKCLIVRGMRRP